MVGFVIIVRFSSGGRLLSDMNINVGTLPPGHYNNMSVSSYGKSIVP